MRLCEFAAAAAIAVTLMSASSLMGADPADAAARQRVTGPADEISAQRDVSSQRAAASRRARRAAANRPRRAPTRFTVRRERSFLDPGTEVLPRSQSYTDYALPPLSTPTSDYDPSQSRRYPLPDSYYLPGYVR